MQELPLADGHLAIGQDNAEVGRLVSVDLHALVERVYVGQGAPPWYADLVRKVVTRFGYQWPVETSDLDARPLY